MNRTDEDIKVDVVNQLDWNASVDASDVKVEVEDGKVILSGSVNYFSTKRSAEDSTWLIPGVIQIDNRISVNYPTAVKIPTDEEIKQNVENVILWDSDVFSFEINTYVNEGVVTLEGTVDAYWKKLHTENIASGILGVVAVENKLAVVPTDKYADQVVAENIVSSIDRLKIVDAEEIDVKVSNGETTLSGTVPSWIAKRAVENAAEYTSGVIDVKSFLTSSY